MRRGEIWWGEFPEPTGRRPALIVQSDGLTLSRINTVIVVMLTGNLRLAGMPGNVLLPSSETGLPRDSVANVSQIATLNKSALTALIGRTPALLLREIEGGIRQVLEL